MIITKEHIQSLKRYKRHKDIYPQLETIVELQLYVTNNST